MNQAQSDNQRVVAPSSVAEIAGKSCIYENKFRFFKSVVIQFLLQTKIGE